MSARGITIVGASAGSGKTYRLTQEVTAAVSSDGERRVPLEGLLAVTYTRKAHAELASRIRQKLVAAGAFDQAMRLPLAYIGTVHAACLRLLQEFALDAGLSPHVEVAAGDQDKLVREALQHALPPELCERLDALAARCELRYDQQTRRYDWVTPVGDIMDLARANRIAAADLGRMAVRSAEGLLRLLPVPESDGAALDAELEATLGETLRELVAKADTTKTTRDAVALLRDASTRHQDRELVWRDWAKLAAIAPSTSCRDLVAPLHGVAARYEAHPRLHDDLRALTAAVFEAAAAGLAGYQAWKGRRRVVDYVDMLDLALRLLESPRVRSELGERLELTVVDEFQDTSPIQLALFAELHRLAGRSVWVGDRKQCIFEYAGADPTLMDAVATWVADHGGTLDRLTTNYRSRPELVSMSCELFAQALARHGFSREEVDVTPRRDGSGLEALPPFGLFRLDVANVEEAAIAIAAGVARVLSRPVETPVIDRVTKQPRAVRPGDIAVLVATNREAALIAAALHARGTRAALAREGLLGTPEGTLADSALRWLLDARDSLAEATLDALTGFGGKDPEAWLLEKVRQDAAAADAEPAGWRLALDRVREALAVLSPSEALDRALDALDAVSLCARWPDPAQRVANLDALRALAAGYEDRCANNREAATVAGLLRYWDAIREPMLRRDEMVAADHQHVAADDDAVTVCTYHRSKGLEWPIVILGSLDRGERRDAFEVCPETDSAAFDPERPLEGRWIRYWPWPFGAVEKVPLAVAAAQSDEGRRVAGREDKERARLLYVGFTRARDHLVLAVRVKTTKKGAAAQLGWLDALADGSGTPLVQLPLDAADGATAALRVGMGERAREMPIRVYHLGGAISDAPRTCRTHRWFARPAVAPPPRSRYRIRPSAAEEDWPELQPRVASAALGAFERLPHAITLHERNIDHDVLGNVVHAFLAADVEGLAGSDRLERARRLLDAAGLAFVVRPDALVVAGDTLRTWVSARWPGAIWHREVPLDGLLSSAGQERRVSGVIDLLLERGDEYVIIDHKSFPGTTEAAWGAKCRQYVPQLVAYAELLGSVRDRRVAACWLHLPVGGGMVEVRV